MKNRKFWFVIDKGKLEYVQDNVTGEKITVTDLEDLLNTQQATINKQKEENEKLQKIIDLTNYQLKVQDRIIKEYEDD